MNSAAKRNIRGAQRHSVAKQAELDERSGDVHQRRKRRVRIEDSEGNPVTKFEPELEEILNGKFGELAIYCKSKMKTPTDKLSTNSSS